MISAWQVEVMLGLPADEHWEIMNAPDPNEGRYKEAGSALQKAKRCISEAVNLMVQAAESVRGLPMEYQILSLVDAVEDLGVEAGMLTDKN